LAFTFEIVADPELGGIVDTADIRARNEVTDPQLLVCVQHTVLSAVLPGPEAGGREALEVTIPTEDAQ
jgi:hypothetical protein